LIRDAAYESLTHSVRKNWHGVYGAIFNEWRSVGRINIPLEAVARHFGLAQEYETAAILMRDAGKTASGRYANTEAISLFQSAINLLSNLKDGDEAKEIERQTRLLLNAPITASKGWASDELEANNMALLALCEIGADFEPRRMLFNVGLLRADNKAVESHLCGLERLLSETASTAVRKVVLRCQAAKSMYVDGEIVHAKSLFLKCLDTVDLRENRLALGLYDLDSEVAVRSSLAWLEWFSGNTSQAISDSKAVIALARELNHPFSMAYALCIGGSALLSAGEFGMANAAAREASAISEQYDKTYRGAYSAILEGGSIHDTDPEGACRKLEMAEAMYVTTGAKLLVPWIGYLRSRALHKVGRLEEARTITLGAKIHKVKLFQSLLIENDSWFMH
jgi:hypothetical protein